MSTLFNIKTRQYTTAKSGQTRIRAVMCGSFRRATIYIYDYALSAEANHRAAADQCAAECGYGYAGAEVTHAQADGSHQYALPEVRHPA